MEDQTINLDLFSQTGEWVQNLGNQTLLYLPIVLLAIAVLVIGFWITKRVVRFIERGLEKSSIAPEVSKFLVQMASILLKIIILLSAASIVGIEIAAILGLLATAGIAIGLSLQGSLSNFAAGLLIMIFKPYKIGDWVEIQEKFGKVEEIQIFNTKIVSPGQKTLIIPNGQVIEGVVTNFSEKGQVRMELEVSMPYEESFPKVKQIILEALNTIPEILQVPEPEVGIIQYESHNIIVGIRPFVKPDDFWNVTYETYRKVKIAFNEANVKVAYSEGIELGAIGN